MRFVDREDAGRALAHALSSYRGQDVLVVALPRGGVPVARVVADALGAPLHAWCVRKLGAPGDPEIGVGAIAEGGAIVVDAQLVRRLGLAAADVGAVHAREAAELARRAALYRSGAPCVDVRGRTVIVVDDGAARGVTMRAALHAVRAAGAARIVAALPVAPVDVIPILRRDADDVVIVRAIRDLESVGAWYDDFAQTTDEEVLALLKL